MKTLLTLLLGICILSSCTTERGLSSALEAERLVQQQRYEEAILHWEQAVANSPMQQKWHYNLIWTHYEAGQADRAVELSDQAIELFEGNLEFFLIKAKALAALGSNEDSYQVYQELFSRNPGSWDLQVKVMKQAYEEGFEEIAQTLALALIKHKHHEQDAMEILSAINPDSWYHIALAYLTR